MTQELAIGALAEATGVSPRSLRYYEQQGLLRPARARNGWRRYVPSDVERVLRIQHLFAAGLSSATIRDVLPCLDAPVEERTEHLREVLQQQVSRLQHERRRVEGELEVLTALLEEETAAPPER